MVASLPAVRNVEKEAATNDTNGTNEHEPTNDGAIFVSIRLIRVICGYAGLSYGIIEADATGI
jgi:hypothetical protein